MQKGKPVNEAHKPQTEMQTLARQAEGERKSLGCWRFRPAAQKENVYYQFLTCEHPEGFPKRRDLG